MTEETTPRPGTSSHSEGDFIPKDQRRNARKGLTPERVSSRFIRELRHMTIEKALTLIEDTGHNRARQFYQFMSRVDRAMCVETWLELDRRARIGQGFTLQDRDRLLRQFRAYLEENEVHGHEHKRNTPHLNRERIRERDTDHKSGRRKKRFPPDTASNRQDQPASGPIPGGAT